MNAQRTDRSDFEDIALQHLDAMYGVAYRLTRNPRDAEDLVQDAVLRAYRFWHTFQKDSNCRAWLFRILTNTFINGYQKKKRGREVLSAAVAEQEVIDGVLVHQGSRNQRDPEGVLLDRTLSDDVAVALESLAPEFRMAVLLCDVEGFSYKEIADIMECPVGTVMSRLYRGRRQLKKHLHDFAVERGIIKVPKTTDAPDEINTIDLDAYRRTKARGRN